MIPKSIHYCWFGGAPLPPIVERSIASWNKHLDDYTITLWDESNSDLGVPVVADALKNKMWAFASDYIRLKSLYDHGGIYLDTDMEVIRSLDSLLDCDCFVGEESDGIISGGIIGAKKHSNYIKSCLDVMEAEFEAGRKYTTIPVLMTKALNGIDAEPDRPRIYSSEYFYPFNPYDRDQPVKQLMYSDITTNTYAIHHWYKSWKLTPLMKARKALRVLINKEWIK